MNEVVGVDMLRGRYGQDEILGGMKERDTFERDMLVRGKEGNEVHGDALRTYRKQGAGNWAICYFDGNPLCHRYFCMEANNSITLPLQVRRLRFYQPTSSLRTTRIVLNSSCLGTLRVRIVGHTMARFHPRTPLL